VTLHHETKELPIYALVVAKNGPKLHESAAAPDDAAPQARSHQTDHNPDTVSG
jgi:uncharacterized protein (TIGR03435 family)